MFPAKEDAMARRRHELTDAQWGKIEHLLPGKKSDPGRTAADNRLFVDAGRVRAQDRHPLGRPARPVRQARHRLQAVRPLVRRRRVGEDRPGPGRPPDLEEVQLDSMTAKAHPVATTGRRLRGAKTTTPTRAGASASAAAAAGWAPRPTPRSTAAGGW